MEIIDKIKKAKNIGHVLPDLGADELEKAIIVSAESYYNTGISIISDEIYDILVDKLKQLNPSSSLFKKIGISVKGKKVKLPYWMGSMDKIKSDEKLINQWKKTYDGDYMLSDKLDGVSCLLVINNGNINLYTRGDGSHGQDISHLIELINVNIKSSSLLSKDLAIRGELIMKKKSFEKYEGNMANARNMVAGIVNSKKESINKNHAADIDLVSYEIIKPALKPSDQMKMLNKWDLNVVYYDIYEDIDLGILTDVLQKRKKKSVYEIDGIIVTDNKKHDRNESGNPAYSFAFKGISQTADVKVLNVHWKPSKDGILVPTIIFEKVRLSGVDLQRTHGFNASFIINHNIGKGAVITVVRSGDVIPYIMDIVTPAKSPALPTNYKYRWDKNRVNFILTNADDDETVIIQRITKFVRDIGVENLSEGIVTKLVNAGYNNIPKIITLSVDDLLKIEGFKETLANKLHSNLQSALEKLNLLTLMVASNIFGRGFGEKRIKKILDAYPDIVFKFNKNDQQIWENKLSALEGFDSITTNQFLDSLPEFQKFYHIISKKVNVQPHIKKIKKKGLFQDEIVVFTGFRNKLWEKMIEDEGGEIGKSVGRNTTLLVYNDGEEDSNKSKTAKKLGIKTMNKSAFASIYKV